MTKEFWRELRRPLPREPIPYNRVVLEVSRSSAEAVADEEEYFDVSADSLELNCKKMRLDSNLESLDSEMCLRQEDIIETQEDEELPDSPESPDESLNSEIFVVEEHADPEESVTSSKVLEYLEQVNQEDSNSYFVTPPDPLRKINSQPISPLNYLEERRHIAKTISAIAPQFSFHSKHDNPTEAFVQQVWPGHNQLSV